MADSKPLAETSGLPLQGPHWHESRSREASVPPRPLRLVLHPWGKVIELAHTEILVGRHSEADLCVRLPDVSRRHCRLVFTENQWQVFDLQSLNGLFVNEKRVEHAPLHHRDTIRIGSLTLEVDLRPGEPTMPYAGNPLTSEQRILGSIREALPEPGQDKLAS